MLASSTTHAVSRSSAACPSPDGWRVQAGAGWGMTPGVVRVQRLAARALVDDSPAALVHAKAEAAAGDESWAQWVQEYQRGEALILRLELTLELGNGDAEVVTVSRHGFFVENHPDAPKVEQQVAELASSDLSALASELGRRGHDIDLHELSTMYVHVELGPEVRRRVNERGAAA
jgi:hypothetical protein